MSPIDQYVDVITVAKTDLKAGTKLDALGGYTTYGWTENTEVVIKENLIPIGLIEGTVLKRDIKIDEVISYDDVEIPESRLCDKLRAEMIDPKKNELNY